MKSACVRQFCFDHALSRNLRLGRAVRSIPEIARLPKNVGIARLMIAS